jgi:hypothetical protein
VAAPALEAVAGEEPVAVLDPLVLLPPALPVAVEDELLDEVPLATAGSTVAS